MKHGVVVRNARRAIALLTLDYPVASTGGNRRWFSAGVFRLRLDPLAHFAHGVAVLADVVVLGAAAEQRRPGRDTTLADVAGVPVLAELELEQRAAARGRA
jgi:hypothetical protein